MKQYRVTFVLPGPSILPGGGYNAVYQLAHGLNKRGIKAAIIFLRDPSKFIPDYKPERGARVSYRLPVFYRLPLDERRLRRIFDFLFNGKRIKLFYRLRFYKLLKVDYDHSVLDNVDLYYYSDISAVKLKTDLIIATHWTTAYFVNEFLKYSGSKPLYLVFHSEDEPSYSGTNSVNAEKTYHFSFQKIVINKAVYERFKGENPLFFHLGIDTGFFRLLKDVSGRGNTVLIPLRVGEDKGARYAIECIRKLLDYYGGGGIKIITFGDYEPQEIPVDLKDRIEHHFRPTKELLGLYNESSIFVLPSLVEGMGLPPLEAMACGCAVVVTDCGGTREYIVDGVNGLVCPIKDAECLFNKVLYLLNNESKRKEIVENGLKTAKQFSYEQMVEDFLKIIKQYLD